MTNENKLQSLTKERIEAIRQRAEKATKGPWVINNGEVVSNTVFIAGVFPSVVAEGSDSKESAEFIANARQDIPDLLAEVERLQAELERINEERENDWLQQRADEERADLYGEKL